MPRNESISSNMISGKVVAEATGAGVADLVVVALDYDRFRLLEPPDDVADNPSAEHFRNIAQREQGVAAALAAAQGTDEEQTQLQRLGSVITDPHGAFQLEYDDDLFADRTDGGDEVTDRRPDLVLLVLAPDRPGETGGGRLLHERLLHYTRPAQFASGRRESFVIRIPDSRLAEFGVPVGEDDELNNPAEFQQRAERGAAATKARRAAATELFARSDLPRVAIEKKAFDKILTGLARPTPATRTGYIGFAPGIDRIEDFIWEGFRGIAWLLASTPRTGRVHLSDRELTALGVTAASVGAASGATIDYAELMSLLGYSSGPYRNRNLLSQVEVRRAIANLVAAHDTPAVPAAPVDAAPTATEKTLRSSILSRLQEQADGLARDPATADPANDLSRLRTIIDQLEQSSGIGNASAMHDVDVLQVAFEPAWGAAFSPAVLECAQGLYRATVKEDGSSIFDTLFGDWSDLQDVQQLRKYVGDIAAAAGGSSSAAMAGVGDLARELSAALREPYAFEHFTAGTINYGILQTYRQTWTPIAYQAGRVVDSIALTPSETLISKLAVTVKRRRKQTRRELSSFRRTDEDSSIGRTEIEAMEKTAVAMSMQTSAQGSFNVGVGSIGSTATFNLNQNQESQRMHKSFAEIARKSSQEVRRETEVQYEVETTEESTSEVTRTLRNANDEMTVTYVLYELERRYRVASCLQAVQPVLLVALPMPDPGDIDEAWLLEHAWVIREVLLDRELEEALDILEDNRSRDDAQLAVLKANYEAASAVRKKADMEFERLSQLARTRREEMIGITVDEKVADVSQASTGERAAAAVLTGGISELFGGGQSNQDDILRARREAAEKQLQYLETEIRAAAETRGQAAGAFDQASDRFSMALTAKAMADQKLLQLRLHVKGNVFHYLHEIWRRRDADDLFFSLYDVEVPFLPPQEGQCKLRKPTADEREMNIPGVVIGGEPYMVDIFPATTVPDKDEMPRKRLVEIADLDRPLGFKGNFVIFPLRESSLITDFMTVGFLDGYYGVRDPGLGASFSAGDLLEYARSVWNDPQIALTDEERDRLGKLIVDAGHRNPGYEAEVVLPTGKVWMEALKGGQALLEPFKLAHRGLDVLKVEEEVRRDRIDNLRRVQRIGQTDPLLGDPDVEKTTIVRGVGDGIVIDPD